MGAPAVIQFRAGGLAARLAERVTPYCDSIHRVARRDLERYYTILAIDRRRIPLTKDELALVLDALTGIQGDQAHTALTIPLHVADYVRITRERDPGDRPDQEIWPGVSDAADVARRISCLGVGELYALADIAERFWAGGPEHDLDWAAEELGA